MAGGERSATTALIAMLPVVLILVSTITYLYIVSVGCTSFRTAECWGQIGRLHAIGILKRTTRLSY